MLNNYSVEIQLDSSDRSRMCFSQRTQTHGPSMAENADDRGLTSQGLTTMEVRSLNLTTQQILAVVEGQSTIAILGCDFLMRRQPCALALAMVSGSSLSCPMGWMERQTCQRGLDKVLKHCKICVYNYMDDCSLCLKKNQENSVCMLTTGDWIQEPPKMHTCCHYIPDKVLDHLSRSTIFLALDLTSEQILADAREPRRSYKTAV